MVARHFFIFFFSLSSLPPLLSERRGGGSVSKLLKRFVVLGMRMQPVDTCTSIAVDYSQRMLKRKETRVKFVPLVLD